METQLIYDIAEKAKETKDKVEKETDGLLNKPIGTNLWDVIIEGV